MADEDPVASNKRLNKLISSYLGGKPKDTSVRTDIRAAVREVTERQRASEFSTADYLTSIGGGLLAIPLCDAGWHSVVSGEHVTRGSVAIVLGLVIGGIVGSYHWWKDYIGGTARTWTPILVLPLAIILAFIFFAGPDIYRRSVTPSSTSRPSDAANAALQARLDAALRKLDEASKPAAKPISPALTPAGSDAAKWQFSYLLRNTAKAPNGERLVCKYALVLSPGMSAWNLWSALQGMLDLAHWEPVINGGNAGSNSEFAFPGTSILVGPTKGNAATCAFALGKVFGAAFPDKTLTMRTEQATSALASCNNECVELDVGN